MRSSLAFTLVASVLLFGVRASALHVHAYIDHDHEEHHHSPATHDHDADADADHDDEARHVSACDPAAHIVRIAYLASPTTDVHPVVGEVVMTAIVLRAPDSVRAVQLLDVRGHGPPPTRSYSLRAPPAS